MKMPFMILSALIIIFILVCVFFYLAKINLQPCSLGSVCIKPFGSAQGEENCFKVEVAKTEAQRNKGLMGRKELDKDNGMIFVFDKEGIYPFWMKNTLIPLDMIWIKENPSTGSGQVVFISQNVQPCKSLICPSVFPNVKAKYVLEINAGIIEKINLKVGDELKINI